MFRSSTLDRSRHQLARLGSAGSRIFKLAISFLDNSKYLLFQEKCRICKRYIHPDMKGMDYKLFRPPASIIFKEKELQCDAICRFCWRLISSEQPMATAYELVMESGEIDYLKVISAVSFQGETKKVIYQFKYDGDLLLAKDLAMLALAAWQKIASILSPDLASIVAVPLHRSRLRE